MDQAIGTTTSTGLRARRGHVRDEAFARRSTHHTGRFETPAWLERSFVLPVLETAATDLPSQSHARHDVLTSTAPAPRFVRPPSKQVDFARVVKMSDATRMARRALLVALVLGVVALGLYWLTASAAMLTVATLAGGGALGAGIRLVGLRTAPVPHLHS